MLTMRDARIVDCRNESGGVCTAGGRPQPTLLQGDHWVLIYLVAPDAQIMMQGVLWPLMQMARN